MNENTTFALITIANNDIFRVFALLNFKFMKLAEGNKLNMEKNCAT